MSAWLWLLVAILFEVAGTTCLKLSSGLSKTIPALLTGVFYVISFSTLAITLKSLEVGLAYAIWAGLGTALIALIGVLYFGESLSLVKILSILLIIAGVVGLNLSGGVH
ncbi:MAG: DMT family transporter [Chlamydiales bacterium]